MANKKNAKGKSASSVDAQALASAIEEAVAPLRLLTQQQQAALATLVDMTNQMRQTSAENHQQIREIHQTLFGPGLRRSRPEAAARGGSVRPAEPSSPTSASAQHAPVLVAPSTPPPPPSTASTPMRVQPMASTSSLLTRYASFWADRPSEPRVSPPPRCATPRPPFVTASSSSATPAPHVLSASARMSIAHLTGALPGPSGAPTCDTTPPSPVPDLSNDRRLRREDPYDGRLWMNTTHLDLSSRMASTSTAGATDFESENARASTSATTLVATTEGSAGSPVGKKRARDEGAEPQDAGVPTEGSAKRRKVVKSEGKESDNLRRSARHHKDPKGIHESPNRFA